MRIGLDGIPLTEPKTGVGHYTFELARALAAAAPSDEFELVYPSRYRQLFIGEDESSLPPNLRTVRVSVSALGRRWWSFGLPRYIGRTGQELFHGTNYDVPLWDRCPTVLTIHDLSLFLYPETHEPRRVRRARRRLPLMARKAAMIITPSESIGREVCEHLDVDPEKVVAVPEAPRRCFRPLEPGEAVEARKRLRVEGDFLLFVGTIEPRKNLRALVDLFAEAVASERALKDLRLVIAGKRGWLTDEFFAHAEASRVRDHLHFTGYVSDEDLRALYSSCRAFVYPSRYEGFGLPLLEAMACGAPVITNSIPSIAETVGGAARLVNMTRPGDFVQSIIELLADEEARSRLSLAGRRHAARFSWERTAQLTLGVYSEALRRWSK